jgi:hypothetical protein
MSLFVNGRVSRLLARALNLFGLGLPGFVDAQKNTLFYLRDLPRVNAKPRGANVRRRNSSRERPVEYDKAIGISRRGGTGTDNYRRCRQDKSE